MSDLQALVPLDGAVGVLIFYHVLAGILAAAVLPEVDAAPRRAQVDV